MLIVTRLLAAVIVPVLVAAFIILYFFYDDTGRLFAWPIAPPMSAMMLGATYLGGAYFFTRVIFARRWHAVRLGFLPVATFAGIMGVATVLHWDRFSHGSVAFSLWALLYFTLPFVIAFVWYFNERVNRGDHWGSERHFSRALRLAIGIVGAVLLVASMVLLFFPEVMIQIWPWQLSPLTARAMAAMYALPGLVGLGVARDGRWSSASIIFQAQVLSMVFILLALAGSADQVQWNRWEPWGFLGGILLMLVLIGLVTLQVKRSPSA